MNLSDICKASDTALAEMSGAELANQCLQLSTIFNPGMNLWLLVVMVFFAIAAAIAVLIQRTRVGSPFLVIILEAVEASVAGAAAGYAGVAAGFLIALIIPPMFLGVLFGALAIAGVLFGIAAALRGDASGGWKAVGMLHFLALSGMLALMSIACFLVPDGTNIADTYSWYLFAFSVGLGTASGVNGIIASAQRGNFYWIGSFPLAINGSWGFIGNLLGLMTHFASMYCYRDFGKRHVGSERICFVCYERGFSVKSNSDGRFAFSQGAVMSAHSKDLRVHEGIHIAQHYVFGPIYPLSYALWSAVFAIAGIVFAAIKGTSVGEGITRMSYYDNPWEVIAYGIANASGRPVSQTLIWNWGWSWLVALVYVALCSAGFLVWLGWLLA